MNSLSRSHRFRTLWNMSAYNAGSLYTWGNFSLGCGIQQESQADQLRPRKVDFFKGNVKKVYPGYKSTAVITDEGDLYMFGCNKYGQLGVGNNNDYLTPQLVTYFKEKGLKILDVSVGYRHTAAIASDGNLYTWGSSAKSFFDSVRGRVGALGDDYKSDQAYPQPVARLRGLPQPQYISVGKDFTNVVNSNNEMYNWGVGRQGQFGNGYSLNFQYPEKNGVIDKLGKAGFNIKKMKSCFEGTLALLNDGSMLGWGRSYFGSLGVREQEYVVTDLVNYIPMPVNTKYMNQNEKVVDFDLGYNLSVFLTDQNRVFFSGTDLSYVPKLVTQIGSDEKVLKVAASHNSFAVQTDKQLYATHDYLRPLKKLNHDFMIPVDQQELFGGKVSDFGGSYFTRYAIVEN